MSCVGEACGTGTWVGPKPGDPDNNVSISANVVFGGIAVRWTYPNTNKAAVAHWTLYRGLNADFTQATELAVLSASVYFDPINDTQPTQYYYWVQMRSVNNTLMDPIGPASTISVPRVTQTLESLTGQIDEGKLAQALKTDISGITTNRNAILAEAATRYNSNLQMVAALTDLQSDVNDAMTYIGSETIQRTDAISAFASQLDLFAADINENSAAILTETTVRATETEALSERVDIVSAESEQALAMVQQLDSSFTLGTHALAQSIKTVEAAVNGNVATGQLGLIAEVDQVTGALSSMLVAKVQVNGLVGGFGIHNDGITVEAGFDVDRFWIGRTNENAVKPFIVAGGVVYMDEARIRNASIDTLLLKGEAVTVPIVSSVPGTGTKWGPGENNWYKANEGYIHLQQDGMIYILCTTAQGFRKNDRYWSFAIQVNGAQVRSIMGRVPNDAPVLSASVPLTAGTHKIELMWSAHGDVLLGYTEIFMMGVKK